MKKAALVLFIMFISQSLISQQKSIDSIIRLIGKSSQDKITASRYIAIASKYHTLRNDSLHKVYTKKAIELAKKHNWKDIELIGKFNLIDYNNQATALSLALECLRLSESLKDTVGIINSMFAINLIYTSAEDYMSSLEFSRRMLIVSSSSKDSVWRWNSLYSLAKAFILLEKADSGLLYAQEAYRHALLLTDFKQKWINEDYQFSRAEVIAWSLHALGKAQQLLKDDNLALDHFFKGLEYSNLEPARSGTKISLYSSIAHSFLNLSQKDSVVKYSHLCLAEPALGWEVIEIYTYLAKAYEGINNDSSVSYYKLASESRAKLFTMKMKAEITDLTKQENERQNQLLEISAEEKENRKKNLQLVFIGIGLISFCILYLAISQSIIVKSGLVRFLGVLTLLLVFEFINLFLHPLIGNLTHHSPVWMFLIMVSIAALLVPAHHKIESWITYYLVEKNKKIRLAAAKKTIQQLEGR